MWKGIVSNAWRFGPTQYIHRVRSNVSGGKIEFVETVIDNVPLQMNESSRKLFQDKNGHHVEQVYQVMIPTYFFDENTIMPALDDMIIVNNIRFRVISIQDINMMPHFEITTLYVRRDELAY